MATIKKGLVLTMNRNYLGEDKELGENLIKVYFATLAETSELPETIIFYNSAVKLMCEKGQILDDLKTLKEKGVEILGCGTCLGHYGLKEKVLVGEISNMPTIVEKTFTANNTISP